MPKKLISFILTLLCVAVISFVLFNIIPGDAALAGLGMEASEEQREALRAEYGYDRPLPERFVKWFGNAVTGDFGQSLSYEGMSVSELIADRIVVTLLLAVMALCMIVIISVPLGLLCASKPGGIADRVSDTLTEFFMAVPSFVQGIILTYILGIGLKVFRPGGFVSPKESLFECISFLKVPALCIAIPKIAQTVRFMKTAVKGELQKDYVRTAKAKGNDHGRILWHHVLQNSLLPVITFVGLITAEVLAGSIMVEQVFNVPGLGRLLVTSISNRDFNVVQAIVMYIAFCVILVNLLTDLLYRAVDPRLR